VTSIAERQTTGAQNEVNISEWKSLWTSLDRWRGRLDVFVCVDCIHCAANGSEQNSNGYRCHSCCAKI